MAMMACKIRCHPTVCAAQGSCGHTTPYVGDDNITRPNVAQPCVQSKGNDNLQHPTLSDPICFTKAMMACHARRRRTSCIMSKGDDGKPCSMSSNRGDGCMLGPMPTLSVVQGRRLHVTPDVVRPLALPNGDEECHAQRHPTMCATQGLYEHAMPDVIRSCVLSMGDDNMSRTTSYDHVWIPMAMMASHARRRPTVCTFQGR
ncbi:hypothetical protein EJD97_022738 [Solanum chilense]|uniref:Uncharacterized protein n=1 Tax=Solanum chilense TaxID=4083 RepID=A0A6N2AVB1_SOLCI|nr:hypothetical protein EJD97_022738 [Solanum chilense]